MSLFAACFHISKETASVFLDRGATLQMLGKAPDGLLNGVAAVREEGLWRAVRGQLRSLPWRLAGDWISTYAIRWWQRQAVFWPLRWFGVAVLYYLSVTLQAAASAVCIAGRELEDARGDGSGRCACVCPQPETWMLGQGLRRWHAVAFLWQSMLSRLAAALLIEVPLYYLQPPRIVADAVKKVALTVSEHPLHVVRARALRRWALESLDDWKAAETQQSAPARCTHQREPVDREGALAVYRLWKAEGCKPLFAGVQCACAGSLVLLV
eukprot:TRINITY_DN6282_c0_g1_i1.p1 TRINITY_DN6282_c0_g1~~TRINITY_DN6282_c0_g1_i1.p1  ORF type:complete len:289 (+),score=77.99 TRINITY_DN6282_c0_g1_i1:64-867(+)